MDDLKLERAPAKINLTLEVTGRRSDGYHTLTSLVAFAQDVADHVRHIPELPRNTVKFGGQFSCNIDPCANSVVDALASLREANVPFEFNGLYVDKNIPLAAGLGGGSADAAAVLRIAREQCPERYNAIDWPGLARKIGADVPVCLEARVQVMEGTGDVLKGVASFPKLYAVLINTCRPAIADKTKRVFQFYAQQTGSAAQTRDGDQAGRVGTKFDTASDVADFVRARGNDLTTAASSVFPDLDAPLAAVTGQPACLASAMTGAGPTVFGLFADRLQADTAAAEIQRHEPNWWVRISQLS